MIHVQNFSISPTTSLARNHIKVLTVPHLWLPMPHRSHFHSKHFQMRPSMNTKIWALLSAVHVIRHVTCHNLLQSLPWTAMPTTELMSICTASLPLPQTLLPEVLLMGFLGTSRLKMRNTFALFVGRGAKQTRFSGKLSLQLLYWVGCILHSTSTVLLSLQKMTSRYSTFWDT